ncbi:MAG: ATP synthase F1 subunit epsilon [Planctomycetes bacterium]|nr:ATP synthase F1 subunit epsilon [Planctomycetota bacterium]
MKQFELEIITPDQSIFKGNVTKVVIPAHEGYLGVLAGHAPFICSLQAGVLIAGGESTNLGWAIGGGLAEVTPRKVTIMADSAEKPEEIDLDRAEESFRRALKRTRTFHPEIDMARALGAFQRAENRMKVKRTKE